MTGTSLLVVAVGLAAATALMWRLPTPGDGPGPAGSADVSVVIPARNEADNLPTLLASIATQHVRPREVLVVDDGSSDDTAAVARTAGAEVVAAGPPPDGWLGKPWASATGAGVATGELLLFLDADTRLAPDAITRLVSTHAELTPDGLLSVQPYHEARRPHEWLSAVCNLVPVLASAMALPGERSTRVAFGPCLLTTSVDLAEVGGFPVVRDQIIEDVALATAYRAHGRPVRCLGGGSTVTFRMYPAGLRSLVEGWTKNLAGGAVRTAPLPTLGAVAWVAAAMSVTWAAVVAPSWSVAMAWAVVAGHLWWMLRRLGSFPWIVPVAFPLPLLAFVGLFTRSALVRVANRPVAWRGRRIDLRRGTA